MLLEILKKLKRFFVVIILLVIVFLAFVGSIALSTQARNWLVTEVVKYVVEKNGYSLGLKEIDTSTIDHWHIRNITAHGHHQLYIESLDIKWQPHNLLQGHISVSELSAYNVTVNDNIFGNFSSTFILSNEWGNIKTDGNAKFNGKISGIPFSFSIKGKGTKNDFVIDNLKITDNKRGIIDLKGSYKTENLDFVLQSSIFSTEVISALGWSVKPDKLKADITIQGTKTSPSINGYVDFLSYVYDEKQKTPISISINMQTTQSILNANIHFHKKKKKLGFIKLSLPVKKYFDLNKLKNNTFPQASLSTDFDLAHIQALLDPDTHNIKGVLKTEVQLDGSWDKPIINGTIHLKDGYYENSQSGTTLHKINTKISAENHRITIIEANATDGEAGKLKLSGYADWSLKSPEPVNFKLLTDSAKVLRRYDMEGVASGNLSLSGSFKTLTLKGVLDITPFSMRMDTLLSQDIPELQVTEEYSGNSKDTQKASTLFKYIPVVQMDITLRANNQAYLRGHGLETELKGKIAVKGTLNKSDYSGSFKTVRGSYEILGKKFSIQEGVVRFEGESFSLVISGIHKTKLAEIKAELSGTLQDLNLSLSSIPSMPQDEVVSTLLFGKPSGNISSLQAIKLANAIRKLKGGGHELFDPLGTAKELLGVDTFSVDSEQTKNGQEVTVGVGKYVNEKVYIEMEKGSNPAQTLRGKIEAEVLPNLNVESSTGGNSGLGGVELQWKHDY